MADKRPCHPDLQQMRGKESADVIRVGLHEPSAAFLPPLTPPCKGGGLFVLPLLYKEGLGEVIKSGLARLARPT